MQFRGALALLLAAAWCLVLPALLAANVYRHLLVRTPDAFLGAAAFEGERRLQLTALLFLVFVGLAWYWREHVPGLSGAARRPWLVAAAMALVGLGWLGIRLNYQPYRVQGSSMLPALKPGDELVVAKARFDSQRLPQRGEVVHFAAPARVATDELVRRVIGLPGDRVEMRRGGFPIINGWQVPTCDVGRYFRWGSQGETNARLLVEFLGDRSYLTVHINRAIAFPPFVVPEGEVFVLADNRNAGADSRNWREGEPAALPLGAIDGRLELILLSKAPSGRVDTTATLKRPGLFFNLHGQDVAGLERRLAKCLRERPTDTSPPGPASSVADLSAAARLGP